MDCEKKYCTENAVKGYRFSDGGSPGGLCGKHASQLDEGGEIELTKTWCLDSLHHETKGGELKLDSDGNPVFVCPEHGEIPVEEYSIPDLDEFGKVRNTDTREVTWYYNGNHYSEERKISELCQYCQNFECEGAYTSDSKTACGTLDWWRNGKLSLVQAISAKRYQNRRHEKLDPLRDWIFNRLEDINNISKSDIDDRAYDKWHRDELYNKRRIAGSFASMAVKEKSAFEVRDGRKWGVDIPASLCEKIEEKKEEIDFDFR